MKTKLGIMFALISALGIMAPRRADACGACERPKAQAADAPAGARTATLAVEGMHCASCPVAVRTALRKLDGVLDATVSAADKRAVVQYDPAKVTPEKMAEAITRLGYKTTVATK